MPFNPTARTVVVFSHPNHELAVYGLMQSLRPALIYLTDGGGKERVDQTRRGLADIGRLDDAQFLEFSENSFYDALLDRDVAFFSNVAVRLGRMLRDLRPAQVLCDAVEFYNPVHDLSLPLVRAALRDVPGVAVFEIPLVYQRPIEGESYEVQRPVSARLGEQISFRLSDAEVDAKVRARDEVYSILTRQMEPVMSSLSRAHLAVESIVPAAFSLPKPGGAMLRYERRAQLLLDRGEIERKITYSGHYLPLVSALLETPHGEPAHAASH